MVYKWTNRKESKNTGSYSHLQNVVIITALPVFLYKMQKLKLKCSPIMQQCVYFLQKYVKLYFKHFRWLTRSVTLLVTLTIIGNISYVCLFRLSAANLRISLLWFVSALWKKFCALKRDIYGHSNSYMSHKCPIYSIYLVI